MKTRNFAKIVFCGLAFFSFASAQNRRAIELNPKSKNVLEVLAQSDEGVEFSHRLGGIDEASTYALTTASYTAASTNNVPQSFTTLSLPGYAYTKQAGYPMLPVRVEIMEVPQGAVPRVVYGKTTYKDIDLAKAGYLQPLYPVQPPMSKSSKQTPDFAYHAEAYRLNGFFSEDNNALVEVNVLGEMRATRLAKLLVKPIQYNAATHTLRIYTRIDFEIVFDHADWDKTHAKKKRYASPAFGLLRHEAVNPIRTKAMSPAAPVRYVIVADPIFKDSLQKFVNWKTRFGFDVVQAYTNQAGVGKTADSIRAYLKGLYDNATAENPAPSYVLFVGDLAQIPTKTYGKNDASGNGKHYSDLYLCEYTGDHFPEVYYGRMSATTVEELMPQIDKTIFMESLKPTQTTFLDTCVAIAGRDKNGYETSHLNPTINYICNYYMKDTLRRHGYKYLAPQSRDKTAAILENFNQGLSVILYTAHGDYDEWVEPKVNVSDVDSKMKNVGKYPLAIGNCCLTGKFDEKVCFGEAILRKKDAGAALYIGASDVTYFDQDVYWAIGYTEKLKDGVVQTYEKTELGAFDAFAHTHNEVYEKWAMTAYEIVYAGNMAVQRANQDLEDFYWEVYHVFGDPSYMPYRHSVDYPQAEYPNELVLGENLFSVQTVPYARITLSKDGEFFGFATADDKGFADLRLKEMNEPGDYDLVVAAQNHLPLQAKVKVVVPDKKYVIVSSAEWLDADNKEAKTVRHGQTYRLRIGLRNVGEETVNKVAVRILSNDEYLKVEDGQYTTNTAIPAKGEQVLEHLFSLKVSPGVPNKHKLFYTVQMVADDEEQKAISKVLNKNAEAPELKIVSFKIDDSQGSKPNGVIDNGETVKCTIKVQNLSDVAETGVKVRVSSPNDFLLLPKDVMELGDMNGQQSKEISFSYSAKNAGVYYAMYRLDFDFESAERKSKDSLYSYIEPVVETFETGDFSFVKWDESSAWQIDANRVHNGKYSAASKPTADKDSSTLKIQVNTPIEDRVGFYCFTSTEYISEKLGDFLKFFIDGKLQGKWGGESTGWKYVEFPVAAGMHTLEWRYVKDNSDNQGEDKVWIDDVRLPIGSHAPIGTANETKPGVANKGFLQLVSCAHGILKVLYDIDQAQTGALYVVNAQGQRIKTINHAWQVQGRGEASFSLGQLPSGVYLLVFESTTGSLQTLKFVVAE